MDDVIIVKREIKDEAFIIFEKVLAKLLAFSLIQNIKLS